MPFSCCCPCFYRLLFAKYHPSSQELLAKTLLLSAEEAADKALASASGFPLSCSADNWSFEGSGGGGGMSDFRRKAHRALNAARAIADQRGLDPHDVETIVLRLCKGWICQPKTSGGCSSGSSGLSVGGGRGGTFRGLRGRGVGGLCAGESVFDKDAREVRGMTLQVPAEYGVWSFSCVSECGAGKVYRSATLYASKA